MRLVPSVPFSPPSKVSAHALLKNACDGSVSRVKGRSYGSVLLRKQNGRGQVLQIFKVSTPVSSDQQSSK
ncbi:hypothetical protein E2320_021914 [Naja naja]|nr:hypothetical protein E2320_021914 [Naja naja]